jgi:glutaminase
MIDILEHAYMNQISNTEGRVTDYSSVMENADPRLFGLSLIECQAPHTTYDFGDTGQSFTLQSISKVFMLMMAFEAVGMQKVYSKVGREPSGDSFGAISLNKEGIPPNPLVNSGAITIAGILADHYGDEAEMVILDKLSKCAGTVLDVDPIVHSDELTKVHRNRAIAHMLRHLDLITDLERTLEVYSYACAVDVTCSSLAVMAGTIANLGYNPLTSKRVFLDGHQLQHAMSHMLVSGMYGSSGSWTVDVGCPAKSGISGGLILSVPKRYGIAIYSPLLDDTGNSVRGVNVANLLDDALDIHSIPMR